MSRVYCSLCDQRGHNRRNRSFHPTAPPLIVAGDRRAYDRKAYDSRYGLKKAVRNECRCGARITEKRRDGEPRSLCRECLDKNATRKREQDERLKRYEAALEAIRCYSLEELAVKTADEALETKQRKAA